MKPKRNSQMSGYGTNYRVNRNGRRVSTTTRRKSGRRTNVANSKPSGRRYANNRKKKRKLNKKRVALVLAIPILLVTFIIRLNKDETIETVSEQNTTKPSQTIDNQIQPEQPKVKKEITDWRLTLANYENILPEDFEVEVSEIADDRQFDARAINDLKDMMNAMGRDGISNVWVQSAYRSVARQKELYDNSVKKYLAQGKTQQEAEKLTDEYINKPGSSDHNLGLAVDFNYVDNKFEDLAGFKWLTENAEDYGFILRYPKDKEDITKISYESWHWRYVGEEHAKKMNQLNMCLEEYIEYLQYEE